MDLQRKTCGPGVLNCIRIFASKNRYIDIDNKSIFVWFSGGQLVKGEVYCQDEIMSTFNQRDKFYFPFQYNLSSNPIQWNVNIDNVQRERGKRLKSHPFHHFKSSILLYNPFVCICSCGLTRKYLIVLILVTCVAQLWTWMYRRTCRGTTAGSRCPGAPVCKVTDIYTV